MCGRGAFSHADLWEFADTTLGGWIVNALAAGEPISKAHFQPPLPSSFRPLPLLFTVTVVKHQRIDVLIICFTILSCSEILPWSMAVATSNLLTLSLALCSCICGFLCTRVGIRQRPRADEGGHPQLPPGLRLQLYLCLRRSLSREDALEQPNEINHWILALAVQTCPGPSTSMPVWKGQWCKCRGRWG